MNIINISSIVNINLLFALSLLCGCSLLDKNGSSDREIAGFLQQNQLNGKILLVQSGMVGCELSEKGLEKMHQWQTKNSFPGLHFARLEINPDPQKIKAYYDVKKPDFPVIRDPEKELSKILGANFIPQYILIDKFGRIRYRGTVPDDNSLFDWVKILSETDSDPGNKAPLFGEKKLDLAKLIPGTRLPDLKQEKKDLAGFRGESGILLLFVDTNCPFANSAINEVPKISSTLKQHKINTLIINIGDPEENVLEFYRKKQLDCPVIYDSGNSTKLLWQIESVPTLILISPADKIFYKGPAIWNDMGKEAAEMLELEDPLEFNAKKIEGG